MRSLNPHWTLDSFHARIAVLAAIGEGDRVLDLGCGRGGSVPHLLAKIGGKGEVVAADRDSGGLDNLRKMYAEQIDLGRLSVVDLNIAEKLPFAAESFDSVVCQNVVECVVDREGLLQEIHRILKSQRSALIGHHDFDGVIIASDDRETTRRLVHGYADHTQLWQDASEGQMGRLLPGLIANSPFHQAETETLLFVDLLLSKESYARDHLDGIVALAPKFGVPAEIAKSWLYDLEARSVAGTFYYAAPWTYVVARAA